MPENYYFIPAADLVIKRTKVEELWKLGLKGEDARVAVVDTGIDSDSIEGKAPIFEQDFTGENNTNDRHQPHGTNVANCVRLIAPDCELLNIKVIPQYGEASKKSVADALKNLDKQNVDIVNISLDFNAGKCNPKFLDVISDWNGAILSSQRLDYSSICELCSACWNLALSGVVVVVAAGNRWGEPTQCPGRSPGILCVEASVTKAEWDYFYTSRSNLRRWWDWKFMGQVASQFGTSFASGYTSGEIALLMPWIRQLGWNEASRRIPSIKKHGEITTAIHLHDSLVFDSVENRKVQDALTLATQVGKISSHLKILGELRNIEPKFVSSLSRENILDYLSFLIEIVSNMDVEMQKLFKRAGMNEVLKLWNYTSNLL